MESEDRVKQLLKNEIEFCEECGMEKNEFGNYIYKSSSGSDLINLPAILNDYKDWLIDQNIVKN